MQLSEIVVGERFRKDLGSIDDLSTSIAELGLLHPILIQAGSNKLIDGERRLKALKGLNYSEIPEGWVRTVDLEEILRGEFDANMIRKAFLPSEIAEIAEAIQIELKEKNRQKSIDAGRKVGNYGEMGGGYGNKGATYGGLGGRGIAKGSSKYEDKVKTLQETYPIDITNIEIEDEADIEEVFLEKNAVEASQYISPSRRELTEKLGYSHETLSKIMKIKKAAEAEPKLYGHLINKMDEEGKIDPAYQQFQRIKAGAERKHYDMSDELLALRSDQKGRGLADFLTKSFSFLPEAKQAKIIKKYGDYCFLVKQSNFDRGIKGFSPVKSADPATLDEDTLAEALEDILAQTREEYEKWVYYDQITNIACTLYNVAESKGKITSTIEKLEFFAVGLGLFTGGFLKYMKQASREKLIEGDFPEELASATKEIFKQIVLLHNNGIITRLAVKRKKDLGGVEEIEKTQDIMHSSHISESMIKNEAELLHYIKQLSAVIGKKTVNLAEKILEE